MPATSPFKFLDAYEKEDKDIFFGRDDEVEQLYNLVFQSNLTLVYGQSGTGKTSLIQCGLANRFAQSDWFNVYIRRNDNINNSLLQSLKRYNVAETSGGTLRERLMRKRQSARRVKSEEEETGSELIRQLRFIYKHFLKPVYLIFDQFEELYILGTKEEQQQFYESIAEILDTEAYCRVIIVMREESIAQLYDFEKVVPFLFDKRLRVEPMGRARTEEVITRSAVKFNIWLENEEVPEQVIEALSEGKGRVELTYLQVFLDQLYQEAARRNPASIGFDRKLIREVGNIEDVLGDFLEKQTAYIQGELNKHHPNAPLMAVRKVLSAFATLEGTKRPLTKEQVALSNLKSEQVAFIVDKLEQARILRYENQLYEFSHDTLALQVAGQRSADEVALLQISRIVRDRFHSYQATRTLLNANELELVNSFRKQLEQEKSLSAEEWAFVRKSRAANRRRRVVLAAVVLAIIGTLSSFALYSYGQQQLAREKEQEALDNLAKFEAAQEQEKAAKYNEYLNQGIARMAQSDYSGALEAFRTALDFNPDGEEARDSIQSAEGKAGASQLFQQLIDDGDALFAKGPSAYVDARQKYQQALDLNYDNSLAQRKLNTVAGRLEIAFEEFVNQGDKFFRANGFNYALEAYRQAARIKPGNSYVQQQIRECRKRMGG